MSKKGAVKRSRSAVWPRTRSQELLATPAKRTRTSRWNGPVSSRILKSQTSSKSECKRAGLLGAGSALQGPHADHAGFFWGGGGGGEALCVLTQPGKTKTSFLLFGCCGKQVVACLPYSKPYSLRFFPHQIKTWHPPAGLPGAADGHVTIVTRCLIYKVNECFSRWKTKAYANNFADLYFSTPSSIALTLLSSH